MSDLLLVTLFPLLVFAIISSYSSLKTGVYSSLVSSLFMMWLCWYAFEWFDEELIIMFITMVIFGGIAIKKNEPFYFKLQPAITGICSALLIIYYEIIGDPLVLKMIPQMISRLPEDKQALLSDPWVQNMLHQLSLHSVFWILLHSIVLAWMAKNRSTKSWIIFKAIFLPYFALGVMGSFWLLSRS